MKTLTTLPIQQGKIDESQGSARVWFNRQSSNTLVLNNGTPYLNDDIFDVEVVSLDIDQCQLEASNIRAALNGYRGMMFPDTVLGVFVSDQADSYEPRNMGADEGYAVASFAVRIIS